MAGFTDAYELTVLDTIFTNTDKVGLGTGGVEENGTGYARVTITWHAAAAGAKTNDGTITFTAGAADWDTISQFAIFTTGGTQMTDWTNLGSSKTVGNGDSVQFADGALSVTLD